MCERSVNHTDKGTGCWQSISVSFACLVILLLSVHFAYAGGGSDCALCHDISNTTGTYGKVNTTVMNASGAVHADLNNAINNVNFMCYACHGNGTTPADHPPNYLTPLNCSSGACHLNYGNYSAKRIKEHVPGAEQIEGNLTNCTTCHLNSLVTFTDNASGVNLTNYPLSNASHYGSKANLITTTDCTLCHKYQQNASTWGGADVIRHPVNTTPSFCDNCHNSSSAITFHDEALQKPKYIHNFDWENDDANEILPKNEDEACEACHQDGQNMSTVTTDNTNICEDCHLPEGSGYRGPFNSTINLRPDIDVLIPRVYAHYNGSSIDVKNQSMLFGSYLLPSRCFGYDSATLAGSCHGVSYYNTSPGGYYAHVQKVGVVVNKSMDPYYETASIDKLPETSNCPLCHIGANSSNVLVKSPYMGYPTNVSITKPYGSHVNASAAPSDCWICHAGAIEPLDFHSANITTGGGSDCISCHGTGLGGTPVVNSTSLNNSIHGNLNNASQNGTNYACYACHWDGTVPPGHPSDLLLVKNCSNCHANDLFGAPSIVEHMPDGDDIKTNVTDGCVVCHNNSVETSSPYRNLTDRVSHYGTNTSLMTPTVNSTNCMWCHFDNNASTTWSTPVDPRVTVAALNHSQYANKSDCYSCHVSGGTMPPDFHNSSLTPGAGKDCVSCHDIGGAAPVSRQLDLSAVNSTESIHYKLNRFSSGLTLSPVNQRCWACHGDGDGSESVQPTGHPLNYKNPKNCSDYDCHALNQSIFNEPMVYEHFLGAELIDNPSNLTSRNITTSVRCEVCHKNSLELYIESSASPDIAVVSHYGSTSDLIDSTNCTYCHEDNEDDDRAEKWGNAPDPRANLTSMVEEGTEARVGVGERWEIRNGYVITVIDVTGDKALLTLTKDDVLLDEFVVRRGDDYSYEEHRIVDEDNVTADIVVLKVIDVFEGKDNRFVKFKEWSRKRTHTETNNTACYACHVESFTARRLNYILLYRDDDWTYFTEVFRGFDMEKDDDRSISLIPTVKGGTSYTIAEEYVLNAREIDVSSRTLWLTLVIDGNIVEEDFLHTGEKFEYKIDMVFENHTLEDVVIFNATVGGILHGNDADIVILDKITAISPDTAFLDNDATIGGYNVSWLHINDTFPVGGIPKNLHVPPLNDGLDGGPDCVLCHDVSMGFDVPIVDAIATQLGAHASLNRDAENKTILTDEIDKACWACHGNGNEPTQHPTNFRFPRTCQSCHTQRVKPYFNATDISDVPHGQTPKCMACHGASPSDVHIIKRQEALATITDLEIMPQTGLRGVPRTLSATAISGFGMRVENVEYFVDHIGTNGTGIPMLPLDGVYDEQQETVSSLINTSGLEIGKHRLYVHASERGGEWGNMRMIEFEVIESKLIPNWLRFYLGIGMLLAILIFLFMLLRRVRNVENIS